MKNLSRTILAAIAALTVGATAAGAVPLRLTTSFDVLSLEGGRFANDPDKLVRSTFSIDLLFADGTVFTNGSAPVETTTTTISGSTIAATNGTSVAAEPTFLFVGNQSGIGGQADSVNRFPLFTFSEDLGSIRVGASAVAAQADGTALTLATLGSFGFSGVGSVLTSFSAERSSRFRLGNFATTASEIEVAAPAPVPLPAALPLLVVALGGLGLAGRRKRRAAALPA